LTSQEVRSTADKPIGREAEAGVIDAFLGRAALGPVALVLSGPAGIGKSTVWRAAIDEARRRGYRTLVTRAVEAEAELAFAGLADLFDETFDMVADRLPEAQRIALSVALQRVAAAGPPPAPLAVSLGAVTAVRTLVEESPVLIAVDDLPWIDGPSARVLDFVIRRVSDLPVGFLPAVRTMPREAGPPVEFAGPVDHLEVGPLAIDAIDELLRRDFALALPRPDLSWLHRECGGNPFFAVELGRALRRTGAKPGLGVPSLATDEEALIRSRLDALPEETWVPLAVVAALFQPTAELVVAAYPEARTALDTAIAAKVLDSNGERLRFSHPLLAGSAYGRLDETQRRKLHERLASVVPDPEQRARHLALAVDPPDPIVAAELETAAAYARGRGAADAAGELQLMAGRLTAEWQVDDLQRRVLAAAEAFIQAGDPGRSRVILEAHIARSKRGPARADALRLLADVRSSDDWEAKLRILDQALEEAGSDPGLRSHILEARSGALYFLMRGAHESLDNANEAVTEARLQDDPAILVSALSSALLARRNVGGDVDGRLRDEVMSLQDQVSEQRVFRWPGFVFALTEGDLDHLESADRTLTWLERRALELGDWDSLPNITAYHADVAYRLGRWRDALAMSREAERGARQNGQRAALSWALTRRAMIELRLGNDALIEPLLREILEVATDVHAMHHLADVHVLSGIRAFDRGDVGTAERELRVAGETMVSEGYLGPFRGIVLADWAESLVMAGRPAEATTLIAGHEEDLRRREAPAALAGTLRAKALAAASAGDEAGAEAGFLEALAIHDRVPSPFPRGRTLLAYGEALRRARQRGRARTALTEAAAIFAALPAPRWLARAEAELGRTGHRAPGARLSATEQQVADLVAAGRTNREVAEALFMSPHTVEAHLTRIYQSLGVRRRTELAAALRATGDERERGSE
jgi:DNA-binding CsgD family transcriptional regulator